MSSSNESKSISEQYHCKDLVIPRANYRTHLRRSSTLHTRMPTNVQDLPAREVNVLNKYTGFPEPLSPDRNTTLPHPDADTSPNATIEAPDLDLTRTQSRNSFLHRRHQSKNSFGKIGALKAGGLYNNMPYAGSTREVENVRSLEVKSPTIESPIEGVAEQNAAANGAAEEKLVNGHSNGHSNGDNNEPASGYTNGHKRTESALSNGDKKKSLFRRLSLHR
ncbi:hypothetical protein V8E51_008646 [Hyaloscypha variabilis]